MKHLLIALIAAPAFASGGASLTSVDKAMCAQIKERKAFYQDQLDHFKTRDNREWAALRIKQADDEFFSKCYGRF